MFFRKSCFLYQDLILVFLGNNQESNGYKKGMQTKNSFMVSCQADTEET